MLHEELPSRRVSGLTFDGRKIAVPIGGNCKSVAAVKKLLDEQLGLKLDALGDELWLCKGVCECDGRRALLSGLPTTDGRLPEGTLDLKISIEAAPGSQRPGSKLLSIDASLAEEPLGDLNELGVWHLEWRVDEPDLQHP